MSGLSNPSIISATVVGALFLSILIVFGLWNSFNFIKNTYWKNDGNTKNKLFNAICTIFIVIAMVETIVVLAAHFLLMENNNEFNYGCTIATIIINFMHGESGSTMLLIFLLRLHYTFQGSIYAYPSKVYKCVLALWLFNKIIGVFAASVYSINDIMVLNKYGAHDGDHHQWLVSVPQQIPTVLFPLALIIYLILNVTLMCLLANGFKLVKLLGNQICVFDKERLGLFVDLWWFVCLYL